MNPETNPPEAEQSGVSKPSRLAVYVPKRDAQGKFLPSDTGQERINRFNRKRNLKARKKLLRRMWGGKVRVCPEDRTQCPWANPVANGEGFTCNCSPGQPCRLEKRMYKELEDMLGTEYPGLVASMLAKIALDMARASHTGNDLRERNSRLQLCKLLIDDLRKKQSLALQARKQDLDEQREARESQPSFLELLSQQKDGSNGGAGTDPSSGNTTD